MFHISCHLMERWTAPVKTCRLCTRHIVGVCRGKSLPFTLTEALLAACVRTAALLLGIRMDEAVAHTPRCRGCMRFTRNALRQKSPVFARLDRLVNSFFTMYCERLCPEKELTMAKSMAAEFMEFEAD